MRASIGPACVALLPVVVWPGLERPFSTPKLIYMVAASAVLALAAVWPPRADGVAEAAANAPEVAPLPRGVQWAALGWSAAFLLAAGLSDLPALIPLTLGLAAPALAIGLGRLRVPARDLLVAQAAGATACGLVAGLQWVGLDPFVAAGWHPPIDGASVRMRVYGTLGNPNFVGVLMAMSIPLTLGAHRTLIGSRARRAMELAAAIQVLALVATGSRGAVLGLCAATATYAGLRWSHRVRLAFVALAIIGAIAIGWSPARPLDTTAAGRLHLWRIVSPRVLDAPFAGHGPGAVELRFPEWQRDAARDGVRDRRFAGLTDHVHNDYLEALVERGVPGALSVLVPLLAFGWVVTRVPRPTSSLLAGSAAAVAAGAACALVDFPLARPVELAWWWVALVTAWRLAATNPVSPVPSTDRHV